MQKVAFNDIARAAIEDIITHRNKIVEEYLKFWIAVTVPDAYLTPEWVADNLVIIEKHTHRGIELFLDFKEKK